MIQYCRNYINNIVYIIALIIYFIKSLYACNALRRIVTIKQLQKIIMLLIILRIKIRKVFFHALHERFNLPLFLHLI